MLDKAKRGYAAKITGEITQVPTVGFRPAASHGAVAPLQMGWALKTATKNTMFSEEQKKYFTEQFVTGEESGKKADPKQVSQDMRKVRSESGVRLFLGKGVFSSQQVSGFFTRLAAKFGRLRQQKPRNRKATMMSSRMQLRLNLYIHSFTRLSTMKLLYVTLLFPFLATFAIW